MAGLSRRSFFRVLGYVSAALTGVLSSRGSELPELIDGPISAYPVFTPKPEWHELAFSDGDEFKFYKGFETLTLQGVPLVVDGGFPMPSIGG
jgi:hypothetical protein